MTSFVAPVVTTTGEVATAVGVPLIGQEILAPAAIVAPAARGSADVQVPTVTPAGSPDIAQVALVAAAVAETLFVHLMVPEYGLPTVAVSGKPVRSGAISEPVVTSVAVDVLFVGFGSFGAPVVLRVVLRTRPVVLRTDWPGDRLGVFSCFLSGR